MGMSVICLLQLWYCAFISGLLH